MKTILSIVVFALPLFAQQFVDISVNGSLPIYPSEIALQVPAKAVAGNLLLAFIGNSGGNLPTVVAPGGWQLVCQVSASNGNNWAGVYSRIATSFEPASYTWQASSGLLSKLYSLGGLMEAYGGGDVGPVLPCLASNTGTFPASPVRTNLSVVFFLADWNPTIFWNLSPIFTYRSAFNTSDTALASADGYPQGGIFVNADHAAVLSLLVQLTPQSLAPAVTILSPLNGATLGCGLTSFFASASDPRDGDLTAQIHWPNGAVGGSAAISYGCGGPNLGSKTVTATVTDSAGLAASSSVTFTIKKK